MRAGGELDTNGQHCSKKVSRATIPHEAHGAFFSCSHWVLGAAWGQFNGQRGTEISTWAGNFTGPCIGSTLVAHLTGPPLLLQLRLSLFCSWILCLWQSIFGSGACQSPTPPLTLVLFCSLFASKSSKGLLNKLHFIWDATKRFSQAAMMSLCTARAAGQEPEPQGTPLRQPVGLWPLFTQSYQEGRGMAVTDGTESLACMLRPKQQPPWGRVASSNADGTNGVTRQVPHLLETLSWSFSSYHLLM